jgi:hypothetical protein
MTHSDRKRFESDAPHSLTSTGDVAPDLTSDGVQAYAVEEAIAAAKTTKESVLENVRNGPPPLVDNDPDVNALLNDDNPQDQLILRENLSRSIANSDARTTNDELSEDWRNGAYPYKYKMLRSDYEKQKFILQPEMLKLQSWVKEARQRIVILFEGRDAAGKGGAIKRSMEHLNPRGARVVALEKPSEIEQGQWYFSATGSIFRQQAKWYSLTVPGIIV